MELETKENKNKWKIVLFETNENEIYLFCTIYISQT